MADLIEVEVVHGADKHRMKIADFRDALVKEIGSVTWTVTRAAFEKKVAAAVDRVIQRVRDEAR